MTIDGPPPFGKVFGIGKRCDPFLDDLEYMAALESEAAVRVVLRLARGTQEPTPGVWDTSVPLPPNPPPKGKPRFPLAIPVAFTSHYLMDSPYEGVEKVAEDLEYVREFITERVRRTAERGRVLEFDRLCASHGLDDFERGAVLLLYAHGASWLFRELLRWTHLAEDSAETVPMTVGTLLSVLAWDRRRSLACRASFAAEAPLVRNGIVEIPSMAPNVVDTAVRLSPPVLRRLAGDRNRYVDASRPSPS